MTKVYFITGANRGIGLALTKNLASDTNNIILASARDPAKATELNKLAEKGNVHLIKLDVSSQDSIDALGPQLEKFASDGIDYFISNGGLGSEQLNPSMKISREEWLAFLTTNTIGPVMMTRVLYPYLAKKNTKVISFISSSIGSISQLMPAAVGSYGLSKAALNYYAKLLSLELGPEGFIVVSTHTGAVSTEMGNRVADLITDEAISNMIKSMTITPEESAERQLALLSKLTKEDNGKFLSYTGDEIPW